jgi:Mg2+-importing ATPase
MAEGAAPAFWSTPADALLRELGTTARGLTQEEAAARLLVHGPNTVRPARRHDALTLLAGQFKSPIILLLIFAASLSMYLGESTDGIIIIIIIAVSSLLQFWQEYSATNAVQRLLHLIAVKVTLLRNGQTIDVPVEEVVPGDVAILNAGDSVPGDCLVLEAKDLALDEATLTGETYPVSKMPGVLAADTALLGRSNSLFMGTHVVSGTGTALIVRTGRQTEFGKIAERLALRPPETAFQRGVRRFGALLMEFTLVLVLTIFAINTFAHRPVLDSFLFALALAVGLTPQLLPAIVSITLAQGARRMAAERVIVKRLEAMENFGGMTVLCCDKTGTLTQGRVRVRAIVGLDGGESAKTALYALLNASLQSGYTNPIDEAIKSYRPLTLDGFTKVDEVPYDFGRKRLSVLVRTAGDQILITKGAVLNVLAVCSHAETASGALVAIDEVRPQIERVHVDSGAQGFRTLALAYRYLDTVQATRADEMDLTFLGIVELHDPPKPRITDALKDLHRLGVALKIITGDSGLVAGHLAQEVGLPAAATITGGDLSHTSDLALLRQSDTMSLFVEIEPNQKERIVRALRAAGHVVGYMGDGINDASALHAADVGISVEGAADVAREAADIVLLDKDLQVLAQGVREGRKTFANTLKYVFMAASANFGNMFSMAGASLFLPFLPLLPMQILLTNLLTDLPEMTIAADTVDPELVERPQRWDVGLIRRFMLTFGLVSSVFDYLTFGVLLLALHAGATEFRSGWFVESVVSASVIVLVIRSRRPFYRSRPGRPLLWATAGVGAATIALPFSPLARLLGFGPIPPVFLAALGMILALYVGTAEATKRLFYGQRAVTRSS